jgi:selenocysteine lyase/cysteine desulfurase
VSERRLHLPGDAIPLLGRRSPLPVRLVGDGLRVPCLDGEHRPYLNLDAGASTGALPAVADRVQQLLPWYSSVHRGAGYKSRQATAAYEQARDAALRFAGRRPDGDDIAVFCRNTTDAINQLAHRLRLQPEDVVVTTVVEHHANLLPWARACRRRFVECEPDGTFDLEAVRNALRGSPRPRLLTVTAASNVSGWVIPIDDVVDIAHEHGVPVLVDAAQLAAHRPLPSTADYVAWSGHKMYAPFGVGVLIGPKATFEEGDPFLVGGGAVDLVDLDEVVWTEPPEREEAGSPNVVGAVALHAAIDQLQRIGFADISAHDRQLARRLRGGLASIDNVRLLGPGPTVDTLPVAAFTIDGVPHALAAARLAAEHGIGVRHGCFCAHPYLMRLLGLTEAELTAHRRLVRAGDRRHLPGAVRASAGVNTSCDDIDRLLDAVAAIAAGQPAPVAYRQDQRTGDYWPDADLDGCCRAASCG